MEEKNAIAKISGEFPSAPEGYSPTIRIFGVKSLEEEIKTLPEIANFLIANGYPELFAWFNVPQINNNQELLDAFYSFLAFLNVDSRYKVSCKETNYKSDEHSNVFAECITLLSKISRTIAIFCIKQRTSGKEEAEIIKCFFDGEFFKKNQKNIFDGKIGKPDGSKEFCEKVVALKTAEYLFQAIRSTEKFKDLRRLCELLLEQVEEVINSEEVSVYRSIKKKFSDAGKASYSKYAVSEEQKKSLYKKFKDLHPDEIENYRRTKNKKSVIRKLNVFIIQELPKRPSRDTTRKWAKKMLESDNELSVNS